MRKFLTLLFFTISTFVSYSQDVFFGKAYLLYTAESDGTELVWNDEPFKCDLLVQVEGKKVTIYSEKLQTYRIVSLKENTENISQYLAVNGDGIRCFLYLGKYGQSEDLGVTIEFNDVGWTYIVSKED